MLRQPAVQLMLLGLTHSMRVVDNQRSDRAFREWEPLRAAHHDRAYRATFKKLQNGCQVRWRSDKEQVRTICLERSKVLAGKAESAEIVRPDARYRYRQMDDSERNVRLIPPFL